MWFEIFKSGEHTDSAGNTAVYSGDDIQAIADTYNERAADESWMAPVVKGHPKTDAPAYGWVEKLKVNGGKLLAKLKDVPKEFMEEVNEGRYKKVSVALYPDKMLRHLGFLGAVAPAVKGLKTVQFSEEKSFEEYEFSSREYALEQENATLRKKVAELEEKLLDKEYSEFIDGLIRDSKLNKKQGHSLKEILTNVSTKEIPNAEDTVQRIMEFAESLSSDSYLFDEIAGNTTPESTGEFSEVNTDPERLSIHQKASEICRNNPDINYEQAILKALS